MNYRSKIFSLLTVSLILFSGCLSRQSTLQEVDTYLGAVSTNKPGDIQPTVESLADSNQYRITHACIKYVSEERVREFFSQDNSYEKSVFDSFFNNEEYIKLLETRELFQICMLSMDTVGFTLYGSYGTSDNNLVGIYRDGRLVSEIYYLPNAGDISVCVINGSFEDVMIYSCGGGDGGGGWNKVYTLDFISGESQLIKDCEFYLEDNTCAKNTLNFTEHPQARYFEETTL